ncbi:MAG: transglycosylase SLT domain-containing protein [Rhodocyclaceae bacterium]
MKFWALPAMVMAIVLSCAGSAALAQQGDARIIAAREALRTGDRATLQRLAAQREAHPLDEYVGYWLLLNSVARPAPVSEAELAAFFARNPDTVVSERLRMAWLKRLAREEQWQAYLREYAQLARPDAELRCLHWHARLMTGDASALKEMAAEWLDLVDNHDACNSLLRNLASNGTVSTDDVWWRIRRQVDSRKPEAALATLAWLPRGQAPATSAFDQALKSPAQYLDRLPANFATERTGRELALVALTRLAREDAAAAHARLARINDRLGHDERAYAYAMLGYHGALSRLPLAAEWYRAAGDVPLTPAQRAWRVRAALRVEQWRMVRESIAMLPEAEQREPEWIYWLARAHAAEGREAEAHALYRGIAGEAHFYGILAGEELGELFQPPPPDDVPSAADRRRVTEDTTMSRALALYRLDMRIEAVREWIWGVRGKDRDFLVAAAHIALDMGLYDRAINTAELADGRANFDIRFLTPFRDIIEPHVRQQGLDMAWVYGLMRQESRFIVPARSSAGAQGLMQVMPATGKWVAGKIGMTDYKQSMLTDPQTNVLLGTSYMRIIMEDLDNHPVLASAGYNAGPGRARRWRDQRPLEGAIYAETIPFDETRDYVKKVLANAVVYAALLERRPQSLKARLGVVSPP